MKCLIASATVNYDLIVNDNRIPLFVQPNLGLFFFSIEFTFCFPLDADIFTVMISNHKSDLATKLIYLEFERPMCTRIELISMGMSESTLTVMN